jgi:hypothetical protein
VSVFCGAVAASRSQTSIPSWLSTASGFRLKVVELQGVGVLGTHIKTAMFLLMQR